MRTAVGLLARRTLAFLLDYCLLCGGCILGIWLDRRTHWLYGYDGAQLGLSLVVAAAVIFEGVTRTPPGRLTFRLALKRSGGGVPMRSVLALRSLLFWMLVLAPDSVLPSAPSLFRAMGARTTLAVTAISAYAIMLWPAASIAATGGRNGVHDDIAGIVLVANEGRFSERIRSRAGPAVGALWIAICVAFLLLDWTSSFGDAMAGQFRRLAPYYGLLLEDTNLNTADASRWWLQGTPTTDYVNEMDGTVFPGQAEYFQYPLPWTAIGNTAREASAAAEGVSAALKVINPETRWVELKLVADQQFGFVSYSSSVRLLWDVRAHTLRYAPREAKIDSVTKDTSADAKRSSAVMGTVPLVVHYSFTAKRRVEHGGTVFLGFWHFPSLSFLLAPVTESGKVI